MLDQIVEIHNLTTQVADKFGAGSGQYTFAAAVHANVKYSKGTKSLREGALEAYDVLLIRMRWNAVICRTSRIVHDGRTWQIDSFNADRRANEIQLTVRELTAE